MAEMYTYRNTWEPSLSDGDVAHLKSLGLFGARIKGNPYRSHLKRNGEAKALCGAEPGSSKGTRKMIDRTGWLVYTVFESPGCTPCDKCLKEVEQISKDQP
ncbi:hypothetical protein [Variovorax sp. 160MFSha2.1]|uniref:hypothetical protein n=1 Tax=Variovorax sp. 160MFSha2.1 TaxID=3158367 RepID=UPI003AAE5DA2